MEFGEGAQRLRLTGSRPGVGRRIGFVSSRCWGGGLASFRRGTGVGLGSFRRGAGGRSGSFRRGIGGRLGSFRRGEQRRIGFVSSRQRRRIGFVSSRCWGGGLASFRRDAGGRIGFVSSRCWGEDWLRFVAAEAEDWLRFVAMLGRRIGFVSSRHRRKIGFVSSRHRQPDRVAAAGQGRYGLKKSGRVAAIPYSKDRGLPPPAISKSKVGIRPRPTTGDLLPPDEVRREFHAETERLAESRREADSRQWAFGISSAPLCVPPRLCVKSGIQGRTLPSDRRIRTLDAGSPSAMMSIPHPRERRARPSSPSRNDQPEWRNWQTRQLEGLVRSQAGAGSSPVSGMKRSRTQGAPLSPFSFPWPPTVSRAPIVSSPRSRSTGRCAVQAIARRIIPR